MQSKLLSIIIPVYNVEKYIRTCLESIYDQNVGIANYEVIVVNDGTRDNSMPIVHEFAQKYNNLIVINQENQGLSVTRNNGLAIASGSYIWFVDSDDRIVCNCLAYIFNELNSRPGVDIFVSKLFTIDEKTGVETFEKFGIKTGNYFTGSEYIANKHGPYGATQRFILKRSFLLNNNLTFVRGIYHEDAEFGARLLYQANLIYIFDKPIYKYLLRAGGSIMSSWKKKNSEDIIFIYKELEKFEKNFVKERDSKIFGQLKFRILMLSMDYAIKGTDTAAFMGFYNIYKKFLKSESRKAVNFFSHDIVSTINAICCSISPMFGCKLKRRFRAFKKIVFLKSVLKCAFKK